MKFKKYIVVSLEKILHTPHIKVITEIPVARAIAGVSAGPRAAPQVLVTLMILFPLIKYCVKKSNIIGGQLKGLNLGHFV